MLVHTCKLSPWKVETGESKAQVYCCLHRKLQANLGYRRNCHKRNVQPFVYVCNIHRFLPTDIPDYLLWFFQQEHTFQQISNKQSLTLQSHRLLGFVIPDGIVQNIGSSNEIRGYFGHWILLWDMIPIWLIDFSVMGG